MDRHGALLSLQRLGRELRQQCWRARGLVLPEVGLGQEHWRRVVLSCVSARGRGAGLGARAHPSRNRKHRDSVLVRRRGPRALEMPSMPRLQLGMAQGMPPLRGSYSRRRSGRSPTRSCQCLLSPESSWCSGGRSPSPQVVTAVAANCLIGRVAASLRPLAVELALPNEQDFAVGSQTDTTRGVVRLAW